MAIQQSENNQQNTNPWGPGFVAFAGTVMILVGIFQAFEGLTAVINGSFFFVVPNYVYHIDVRTWGWIHLIVGIVVAIAGFSVFSGRLWARVIGIILAMLSALVNFFYIPYYPFWSILIIALDIGVIWALAVFGRREAERYHEIQ
jgi:hypothetical protein